MWRKETDYKGMRPLRQIAAAIAIAAAAAIGVDLWFSRTRCANLPDQEVRAIAARAFEQTAAHSNGSIFNHWVEDLRLSKAIRRDSIYPPEDANYATEVGFVDRQSDRTVVVMQLFGDCGIEWRTGWSSQ